MKIPRALFSSVALSGSLCIRPVLSFFSSSTPPSPLISPGVASSAKAARRPVRPRRRLIALPMSSSAAPAGRDATVASESCTAFLGVDGVPKLGLGLAAIGRPGYINLGHHEQLGGSSVEEMRAHAFKVLDSAWESGVRYFDCARSYGKSEEFLSAWLQDRGIGRDDVVVGSKWGYRYTAEWRIDNGDAPHEVKDHSLQHLLSQQQETQQFLGGFLNMYQIHSATLDSGVLTNQEVLDRLFALKKERGWKVGLSLSGVKQAETLRTAMQCTAGPDSEPLFDSVQATFNLLEQSVGTALSEAKAKGMSVIVKEAMANGRLLLPGAEEGMLQSEASSQTVESRTLRQSSIISAMAKKLGTTPDALALAAVMAQPWEPLVLSGAACPEHMRSNSEALGLQGRLTATPEGGGQSPLQTLMAELEAAGPLTAEEYWGQRSALAWN